MSDCPHGCVNCNPPWSNKLFRVKFPPQIHNEAVVLSVSPSPSLSDKITKLRFWALVLRRHLPSLSDKITKLTFPTLALRRHSPIRLWSWGFQRWAFVVTCQSDYEADVPNVGPSSSLSDKITKLRFSSVRPSSEQIFRYQIFEFTSPQTRHHRLLSD